MHTQGPWHIGGNGFIVYAAFYSDDRGKITPDEAEANARLIAAAPDLLAALILCRDQLVSIGQALGEYTQPSDVDAMNAADAAISKAEGNPVA